MALLYAGIMVVISMAIIIPSRNIYEKNHNKIRDNVIDNVEIDAKNVVADNKYDEVVNTQELGIGFNDIVNGEEEAKFNQRVDVYLNGTLEYVSYAYAYMQASYIKDVNFNIPILIDNHFIQSIKDLTSKNDETNEEETNIKYTIYGKKREGIVKGSIEIKQGNDLSVSLENVEFIPEKESDITALSFPTMVSITAKCFRQPNISSTIEVKDIDISTIHKTKIVEDTENDAWTFETPISILCGLKVASFKEDYFNGVAPTSYTKESIGVYEEYIPTEISITFYGNTIGIDLVDKTVKIGSGNHPFSIGGSNELLQTSNYIDTVQHKAIDTDYNNTLTKYSNGKETATILCSISDYYDESKNKVIAIDNANKMCFRMYDIVEPYVFGADGKDKPLSRNKDGSPKQFQVLGVKPIYDGAVWQELTLQEV